MEHATILSLFKESRKKNPIHDNLDSEVFRLFPPLEGYVVKLDKGLYKNSSLETTEWTAAASNLPEEIAGQTVFTSTNGIEIQRFVEGVSLQHMLNDKEEAFAAKKLSPTEPSESVYKRSLKMASRHVAKMLSELPAAHFKRLIRDVKILHENGYAIDPFSGNIMLNEDGLRLIDYSVSNEPTHNCSKGIKDDLEQLFKNACLEENKMDNDLIGWRKTVRAKLDQAAKDEGVGINTPLKRKSQTMQMHSDSVQIGARYPIYLAPQALVEAVQPRTITASSARHS